MAQAEVNGTTLHYRLDGPEAGRLYAGETAGLQDPDWWAKGRDGW